MSEDTIEQLRRALEPGVWEECPGLEVQGRRMAAMLSPRDDASLCRVLTQLHERQIPVLIRGGGTRMWFGNSPREVALVLSTRLLSGIRRYEPDDGVVEVSAGTTLREVRAAVLEGGWELPIDAGGAQSTIGGAIATAALGPRCLGFGPVRKNVLGLEVVHACGTLTRCGGRVVKNVTGYDLAKLYTGSLGTLGVISAAWLRLQPRPRAIEVRVAEFSQAEQALARGMEASRRSSARACVLLSPEAAHRVQLDHTLSANWILLVEFAGEESECKKDAAWVERELGGGSPDCASGERALASIDAVREALAARSGRADCAVRIATLPTQLEACVRPLIQVGACMTVDPGMGLVYAEQAPSTPSAQVEDRDRVRGFMDVARAAAVACSGSLLIEALPSDAKRALDVFGEGLGSELALMRRLKDEFDPTRLLNPGRFAGDI